MLDNKNYTDNPTEPIEEVKTSGSTLVEFGHKIFKGDKVIWSVFIILCIISLIEIFSATSTIVYRQQNQFGPILRHTMFLIGGVGIILLIHNIPYRFFSSLIFVLLGAIVLLILTPFIGESVNNADRWISIMGFTIQPSEIAKISLMGTIAFLLSKQNGHNDGILFKWMIGLMIVVCGIIAVDNLSTAVLLFGVCYLLMFIGNVKITRLLKVAGVGIAIILLFVLLLNIIPESWTDSGPLNRLGTWQNRITHFGEAKEMTEEEYFTITDENYQVAHAKIAISNGGVFGVFPGNSTERDFLPQAYSDFIYAIIIEEMGLLGGMFVLLLYLVILIRGGIIARKTEKLFPKYLVMGSALMLSIQAFINMAVAVNLIPVTGQPLPLISRGGTSTLITCAYFGLILSADRFGISKKKEGDSVDSDDKSNEVGGIDGDDNKDSSNPEDVSVNGLEDKVEFEIYQV
ncbi:MAG TPA: FtsW/RodA/SpoVE family cell cycle protein [Fermentimonas caenicola]|jgi:cell division protein FtsW|uniref:Probable peptidoglycan glycosyltransferase FtsW n=1 Tax=Fermentimonas caenicola TaxID=1562970 RepID=A0A098BZF5_9BACT|nr:MULTISPECIES: FtsW/RodA/SpoVE family cell cycle protein [Lascolabacillus]MBP6174891.1 FtsW/RodA/SpoVE family cell cycle protein [Fermentimonas sp.]MDI9625412.1 FtsW/RodA/SpoVE family cell cycle protein [Bacteroidota bacterium]CEA14997.1 cell division protein FtsW [Fermentimonas caenicola]MBP6196758.1 FtsW/RodA/SpoVE family cell cycle protein [Fermentimonas sp.]MBP7103680.1 FtsW/RodA/SpoVE family cell cycle protein [Fermentimonas sp.]